MLRLNCLNRIPYWLKRGRPGLGQRGAIGVLFGFALVPLVAIVGLAVDYSFYVSSRSQLNLAADAAALHAVRVASQNYATGHDIAKAHDAGVQAAQQWWAAQLGNLGYGTVNSDHVTINVAYTTSPSSFTANVSYTGTVNTRFGTLFQQASSPIRGAASAVVSNAYVEILMLLDNSPSMLLGSTTADIVALEQATPCSTQSASAGQNMSNYAWVYPKGIGYAYDQGNTPPPTNPVGSCDTNYTGNAAACFYVPTSSMPISNGFCTNGGGATLNWIDKNGKAQSVSNVPQAPCAFACHNDPTNNDYFGLARQKGVTLRLDVVQTAAANVVSKLQSSQEAPNQFTVGVYQFANALQQVFPVSGEASSDLATALTVTQNVKNTPALLPNAPDTNFVSSATALASQVTNGGNGSTQSAPQKNLFIVTDGMEDAPVAGNPANAVGSNIGNRFIGAMTSASNEGVCQLFKNKGFTVYVLYTPFLPVPNPWYFGNVKPYAEPSGASTNVQALQACATGPGTFYQASDPTAINNAMQAMLASALNSAGRISR